MAPQERRYSRPHGAGAISAGSAVSGAVHGLRDPVVVILLLAGFFAGISSDPVQGVVLGGVALALAIDPGRNRVVRPEPATEITQARKGRTGLIEISVALIFAVVVGAFARYSWPATLAVLVPGVAGLAFAWRGPLRGVPEPVRPHRAGAVAWAAAWVALALWELAALLMQPTLTAGSYAHPTISFLLDPVLASHPGRSLFLFVWLLAGWFLVQR